MLFSVKTREQALRSIRYSSIAFIAVAVLQLVASTFLFSSAWTGILLAGLGIALLFSKSRVVAVAMLLGTLYLAIPTLSHLDSILSEVLIIILLLFASVKALEATSKLHKV